MKHKSKAEKDLERLKNKKSELEKRGLKIPVSGWIFNERQIPNENVYNAESYYKKN